MEQSFGGSDLRMPTITCLMKEDKNGPKNREVILGLGYRKKNDGHWSLTEIGCSMHIIFQNNQ